MLAIFACLAGVLVLLITGELLKQKKLLTGDLLRQVLHIAIGSFVAFWPWLIDLSTIAAIGIGLLAVVILNYRYKLVDLYSGVNRQTYGDIFYALAVIFTALLADKEIFFTLAILTMAIGDGLANIIGQRYGMHMRYKVFGHTKTFYGSMVIWLSALCVLGAGLLFANEMIDYSKYGILLLVVPPILVVVENAAVWGLDNFIVPLIVVWALNLSN